MSIETTRGAAGKRAAVEDHRWPHDRRGVNTTSLSVRAAVPLPGTGDAEVLFEGRRVRRDDGAALDDFGRYGVHVVRFSR
jgi:hypothetical protein